MTAATTQTPAALTTTARQRNDTALHESAHAVAALRTGTSFAEIVLDPPLDPACLGILTLPDAPTYRALAVVLCAGIVVDLRLGYTLSESVGSDMEELVQLGADLASETGRAPRMVMLEAFEEARRILRRQHAAVRRVTAALLVDGRLSYDETCRAAQLPGTARDRRALTTAASR